MAKYGVALTVFFTAFDATAQVWKTGDSANITMYVTKDAGAAAASTNAVAEVDATHSPGLYKLLLTAAEMAAFSVAVAGKSSTGTFIIITPVTLATEASPVIDRGTAQAAGATSLQIQASATFATSEIVGASVEIISATAGAGQSRVITAYNGGTNTATVDTWTTTPTGTIVYAIFGTPPGSTVSPPVVNAAASVFSRAFGANWSTKTFEQLFLSGLAAVCGPSAGAGTNTEIFKTPVNAVTAVTVGNDGTNRTTSTLGSPE